MRLDLAGRNRGWSELKSSYNLASYLGQARRISGRRVELNQSLKVGGQQYRGRKKEFSETRVGRKKSRGRKMKFIKT